MSAGCGAGGAWGQAVRPSALSFAPRRWRRGSSSAPLVAMDKLFSPTLTLHIGCGFALVAIGLVPILTRKG